MRSMTGYSKKYFEDENFSMTVEIKSVNNKNLNLKVKIPNTLNFLENKIRTEVSNIIFRGSLDLKIEFQNKKKLNDLFEYDKNIANSYLKVLNEMENDLKEKFSNKIDLLLKNSSIIKEIDDNIEDNQYENYVIEKLNFTLDQFVKMKIEEGERLNQYFKNCLEKVEINVSKIKELKEKVVKNYIERLKERLTTLTDISYNEEDLLKEMLLFADRSDISEEISRLESHIFQLKVELKSEEICIGKKIDFILQEIFRELNTTGVKCNLYDISKLIVECKNEIEKIREQILNIE